MFAEKRGGIKASCRTANPARKGASPVSILTTTHLA